MQPSPARHGAVPNLRLTPRQKRVRGENDFRALERKLLELRSEIRKRRRIIFRHAAHICGLQCFLIRSGTYAQHTKVICFAVLSRRNPGIKLRALPVSPRSPDVTDQNISRHEENQSAEYVP